LRGASANSARDSETNGAISRFFDDACRWKLGFAQHYFTSGALLARRSMVG
jgi:hypothetical protein